MDKNIKKASAILTGDWHLRDDTPTCRTDDYWLAQAEKIKFIRDLQKDHGGIPIYNSGDLFHKWKPSPYLLQWAIRNMPSLVLTIPGNHDLPAHNIDLYEKSGLSVIAAGREDIEVLFDPSSPAGFKDDWIHGYPWGAKIEARPGAKGLYGKHIAIVHVLAYIGTHEWPGMEAESARAILNKMKGYDLVVTGHNHKSFAVEYDGRLLVNPGSIMRMSADQEDFKPRVYLWYADTNEVSPVYLPIEKGVVSREHILESKERNERMESFVARLQHDVEIGFSFEKNLEAFFSKNRVRKGTKDLIWKSIEKEDT